MRRRTAVLGGALTGAVVLVAAAVGIVRTTTTTHDDDRRVPPAPTTTSTSALPAVARGAKEPATLATLHHIVTSLPAQGIGIVDGDRTTLVDDHGKELAWGTMDDARLVSPEDVAIASIVDDEVRLYADADAAQRTSSGDCLAGDTVGNVTVERCGAPAYLPPRIDVVDTHGRRTLLAPPGPVGGWASAKLSPDGRTVLAQWSGECEVPHTFFIAVDTGRVTVTTGEPFGRWGDAPTSTSAGWLADGSAVIARGASGCGTSSPAGVYLAAPGRPLRLLRRSSSPTPSVFAWRLGPSAISGPCDLPVDAGTLPAGWDPHPHAGAAADHPMHTAIAHWLGPDPRSEVITVVGQDGGGLVSPVAARGSDPVEVFTSMGNPAFVVAIHEAFAAQVDPPNAPVGCSPLFLIGESVDAATLRTVAESLRSRAAPPTADITVSGVAVRGARISIRAAGPAWPSDGIEIEVANPDGFGSVTVGLADHEPDGSIRASFLVPSAVSYEGICRNAGNCDLLGTAVGPLRVRFSSRSEPRRILAEGTFAAVAAQRSVAYPSALFRECGPPRVELDGTTWVATEPTALAEAPVGAVGGTIIVRSASRATFRSDDGRTVALRPSPNGFAC